MSRGMCSKEDKISLGLFDLKVLIILCNKQISHLTKK